MFKWLTKNEKKPKLVEEVTEIFKKSSDYLSYQSTEAVSPFWLCYVTTLIDKKLLHESILPYLQYNPSDSVKNIKKIIPIEEIIITDSVDDIKSKLLAGHIMVKLKNNERFCALIKANKDNTRSVSVPEVEFSVLGPKEAFVESLETNINLIRKRLPIEQLRVKEITVGKLSKTKVAVLYVDHIVNKENVQTVLQRISDLDFDHINDSSYINQMIADNHLSPFPQLLSSERPDRVVSILVEGKVAVISDGSPHAIIGPTTLVEFFSAFEDYYLNWYISSFFRLVRFFAVTFSILVTPLYVAVLTYHYELIPEDLMSTLVTSRREVPLPPILEALFLELTIELLREAGARLPTKVGQTIGIVGGIVIGTASVEAGLTSNVLLIIVALAALASFTTPIYSMGNTIRIIRFPFLIFAELWGLLGVVFCFSLMLTHLTRLTSLGRPFLSPIYPMRLNDLKDSIVRFPFSSLSKRPKYVQSNNRNRFNGKEAKENHDIDE
ncbi:spore germination protein [Litchfieldia salsa]|uniref:GerA spore germination protein n=1 Tax=Litchfieldia salsa TaxID=930152 RepID=A0A1H0WP79_9BACI|nr:spore germination protein [Litchfieldia salsa]SDP92469.1 GerA spore germination protein [Litchfieldia salsa]